MKHASLLCILGLLLLAVTCKKEEDRLEAELAGTTWLHSFEEDRGDVRVYRPNTYDFPPSRGRTGFLLEPGGVIKRYDIAPTDGLEEHTGRWEYKENNLVDVRMDEEDNPGRNYTFEIVSLENGVLEIRQKD